MIGTVFVNFLSNALANYAKNAIIELTPLNGVLFNDDKI